MNRIIRVARIFWRTRSHFAYMAARALIPRRIIQIRRCAKAFLAPGGPAEGWFYSADPPHVLEEAMVKLCLDFGLDDLANDPDLLEWCEVMARLRGDVQAFLDPPRGCQPISHANLSPGWLCCVCDPHTYNALERDHCKACDHECCARRCPGGVIGCEADEPPPPPDELRKRIEADDHSWNRCKIHGRKECSSPSP